MAKPPSPQSVRLTIAVTPEVHATFQRLAEASGGSISKAMGEWLGDTVEAAEFMAHTMEKARAAPKLVVQELQAMTLGMGDELGNLMTELRKQGKKGRGSADALASTSTAPSTPRSVIRGGKSRAGNTKAVHPRAKE